jgi:hypothetical protein
MGYAIPTTRKKQGGGMGLIELLHETNDQIDALDPQRDA